MKKHLVDLLVESNKKISSIIELADKNNALNDQVIISNINEAIRSLDHIVEKMEKNN